jgi:hypothetical protein
MAEYPPDGRRTPRLGRARSSEVGKGVRERRDGTVFVGIVVFALSVMVQAPVYQGLDEKRV